MGTFEYKNRARVSVALASAASVLLVVGTVYSATTISNNINTGGTLTVTGASTQTGNVSMGGTLSVTGLATLTGGFVSSASSSVAANLSVAGPLSASSTLTVAGNTTLSGTLNVTGLSTLGYASSSGISISTGANSLTVAGNATTTGSSGQFATQGFIGAGGTSTPAAELSASGAATTTLYMHTTSSVKGSCIELVSATGTAYRLYIGGNDATSTSLGTGRVAGSSFVALWEQGACK